MIFCGCLDLHSNVVMAVSCQVEIYRGVRGCCSRWQSMMANWEYDVGKRQRIPLCNDILRGTIGLYTF